MKLPKEITGRNRLRDLDICHLYIDGLNYAEIKEKRKFHMSVSAIQKVVTRNRTFVNERVIWPKVKRIRRLQKMAMQHEGKLSNRKDYLDIAEQLRKEIEGDKTSVDQSQHKHITIILDGRSNISADRATSQILQE